MLMQDAAELRRLVRSNDNQLRTFLTKISDSAQRFRQGKRTKTRDNVRYIRTEYQQNDRFVTVVWSF